MDILAKILNNNELAEKIRLKCDIELYPQLQEPDDMDGQITWNIGGKAFGIDGSLTLSEPFISRFMGE